MDLSSLFSIFQTILPLSALEREAFAQIAKEVKLSKGGCWVKEGTYSTHIAFVQEGYLRKFYLDEGLRSRIPSISHPISAPIYLPS